MSVDRYELALAVVGLVALLSAWLPGFLSRRALSLPVVLLVAGVVVFALPLGLRSPDPRDHVEVVERASELAVIVSLMGAGLKLDRPFDLRTWSNTWRMLGVAMPLTVGLTSLLGAALAALPGPSALLLGASLAPTDPVLASDVQVGEPTLEEEPAPDAEDEVRFTLTSEGGLNDALAFPFVYAAIRVAEHGWDPTSWLPTWIGWDVVARLVIGLVVGVVVGRVLAVVAFRPPGRLHSLAETRQGFVALAATLLAYGATELAQGYGFLAVFVAAVVLRSSERGHEFHTLLHSFTEQVETLLVSGLLLLVGGALVAGVLGGLTVGGAALAVVLVAVVRPLSGCLALVGSGLTTLERVAVAFVGIRGFGSVYYLAYGLGAATFAASDELWAIVWLTIVLSIVVHGVSATPVMRLVDRAVDARDRRALR